MRMHTVVALLALVALVTPGASAAPPDRGGQAPSGAAPGLADADGDRITDGLRALLDEAAPGEPIAVVVINADSSRAQQGIDRLPPRSLQHRYRLIPAYSALLDKEEIMATAARPGVVRIEERPVYTVANDGSNADFGTAAARADLEVDGSGVGICIVDTGLDDGHEQLDDPGKIAGWFDAINNTASPTDPHGHGTHVAATAAGSGTGGPSAAQFGGVAPGATLYGARVLNNSGLSVGDSVAAGVEWCALQDGVDVISMSLGTSSASDGLDALSLTVDAAVAAGKVVVVAAGNDGDDDYTIGSPAAAEDAITVAAVAEYSLPPSAPNHSAGPYLAPFSSRGPTLPPTQFTKPDIAAPGITVRSAQSDTVSGYTDLSGTSMATPFVAGTVALMLEANPSLSPADVAAVLAATAVDRGPAGKDNHWGWGLIDGHAAVAEAAGEASAPTPFPGYVALHGSVGDDATWQHVFSLSASELDVPIAATILIAGDPVCTLSLGRFGCLQWEWSPDLDARLLDPSGTVIASSTCVAGALCGGIGRQETLAAMPTQAGQYTLEVFPWAGSGVGGDFDVYLSTGPVGTPEPAIHLDKSPDLQTVAAGTAAAFTITVSNVGSAALSDVSVADASVPACSRDSAAVAALDNLAGSSVGSVLEPGEAFAFECAAVTLLGYTNTATASGRWATTDVEASDDAAVAVAAIEITKSVRSPQPLAGPGEVSFEIRVKNPGEVTLLNAAVADVSSPDCARTAAEFRSELNGHGNAVGYRLTPGEVVVYECSAFVAAGFTNVASASATAGGIVVSDEDDAVVTVAEAGNAIVKSPALQVTSGPVTFTIRVKNTGAVTLLSVAVDDVPTPACSRTAAAFRSELNGHGNVAGFRLTPGEVVVYECSDVATADYVNVVTVTGSWSGVEVSDLDQAVVDVQ